MYQRIETTNTGVITLRAVGALYRLAHLCDTAVRPGINTLSICSYFHQPTQHTQYTQFIHARRLHS